jgi:4-diphosphocytidyl-2-C-methyl-D-erythritol kinase
VSGSAEGRDLSGLKVHAPAKINWSLEVLGKGQDGYHEIRTLLQTIQISDRVTLTPADGLYLELTGDAEALAGELQETDLAHRAAARLRERCDAQDGVRIALEKRVPVAAGLGGGSSDGAAVLRGLRVLWELSIPDDALALLAAELGSDVRFFLRGGAALASGHGELLESLPDGPPRHIVLAWPRRRPKPDKTARMYAALRPAHYTDGSRTEQLSARLRAGDPIREEDLHNVFEAVLPEVDPEAADTFESAAGLGVGRPHLCGSGPAFFFLLDPRRPAEPLLTALVQLGLRTVETRTISAAEAVAAEAAK